MKNLRNKLMIAATCLLSSSAFAQTSELKVAADLMIHPDQMSGFFNLATDKIGNSSQWSWPSLEFTRPYRTWWNGVQAVGPFNVKFSTDNLAQREFSFELDWANPTLTVASFEIRDTIVRNVGSVRLIINLDGRCQNMAVHVVQGNWKVKGKMKWDWAQNRMAVSWVDFGFEMNPNAAANIDLGQCQGAQGIQDALLESMQSMVKDRVWLTDILQQGILEWVDGSLGDVQASVMQTRAMNLRDGLDLTWKPATMVPQAGGMLRVAGEFSLTRNGVAVEGGELVRNYDDDLLSRVTRSGFILPKSTISKVLEFLQRTGDLQYRLKSSEVDGFAGLMKSKLMQFFVWPDLMKFGANSQFYFDLGLQASPVLSGGQNTAKGVVYNFSAPAIVHQWAPTSGGYVPYVDFTSALNGTLSASIHDGELSLQMIPSKLKMNAAFRPEIQALRSVSKRIQTSTLDSRVQSYLAGKAFKVKLSDWAIGESMSIGMSGLDQRVETLRIPLDFKSK